MTIQPILQLGDPKLHEVSLEVQPKERDWIRSVSADLFDTMRAFQAEHGWGRAIAAPQIGVHRRLVCMHVDRPVPIVNPVLRDSSPEMVEVWEDCMSFPDLMVRIRNPVALTLDFEDLDGQPWTAKLTQDYATLLIHEVDHLNGQLATERPISPQGLALRATLPPKDLSWHGTFDPVPRTP